MTRDTGFPKTDAQNDYLRARRRHALGRLKATIRNDGGRDALLRFDDVVDALGRVGGCDLGIQTITLDSVVGSVGRHHHFDRQFRPTAPSVRQRFERIAEAQRRGRPSPPVDVLRVSTIHFVQEGHCEVAVAREHGRAAIEAHVVEVVTRVPADASMTGADLPRKQWQRTFLERVPLPAEHLARLRPTDPARYAALVERAEAFGFRLMQSTRRVAPPAETARRWFDDDYRPAVSRLHGAGLVRSSESEADAYLRLTRP